MMSVIMSHMNAIHPIPHDASFKSFPHMTTTLIAPTKSSILGHALVNLVTISMRQTGHTSTVTIVLSYRISTSLHTSSLKRHIVNLEYCSALRRIRRTCTESSMPPSSHTGRSCLRDFRRLRPHPLSRRIRHRRRRFRALVRRLITTGNPILRKRSMLILQMWCR